MRSKGNYTKNYVRHRCDEMLKGIKLSKCQITFEKLTCHKKTWNIHTNNLRNMKLTMQRRAIKNKLRIAAHHRNVKTSRNKPEPNQPCKIF